jgi:hypothetical protein
MLRYAAPQFDFHRSIGLVATLNRFVCEKEEKKENLIIDDSDESFASKFTFNISFATNRRSRFDHSK